MPSTKTNIKPPQPQQKNQHKNKPNNQKQQEITKSYQFVFSIEAVFDTTHKPNQQPNTHASSPNIAQTPSEDPTSRAIGGCRLS
jgi:hypothetical protein